MALTNAERQARYREKRDRLARAATTVPAALAPNETGDHPFVTMLKDRWEVGAKRFLDQCKTGAYLSAAERQVAIEIPQKRPTAVELLEIAEQAGEQWAGKRVIALLTEEATPKLQRRKGR